jgi:hypothetical protein
MVVGIEKKAFAWREKVRTFDGGVGDLRHDVDLDGACGIERGSTDEKSA